MLLRNRRTAVGLHSRGTPFLVGSDTRMSLVQLSKSCQGAEPFRSLSSAVANWNARIKLAPTGPGTGLVSLH